uniref:Pyridoxal phosphate homeostasis protein n=3 Tax=Hemiselmis andersenii TaxID=464988 RepID=A0A6T8I2D2_HEMAN|mmetsp:Transcript_13174/g.30613  ORF Transcript_13174/g.30613 Transcript_13174/m.30613 type:complete len:301 (+) Transcript_13174:3-905(+)
MMQKSVFTRAYPLILLATTAQATRPPPLFATPPSLPSASSFVIASRRHTARLRPGAYAAFATAAGPDASVKDNLDAVNTAISNVCSQLGKPTPRLVAVSKVQPNEKIEAAYAAGHRHFGENYVQELVGKAPELPGDIKWHFIGMLQSNKAKALVNGVPSLYMVESVHSVKTATALEKACAAAERGEKLRVLVQVNTSEEDAKSGCEPPEAVPLAKHIAESCPHLELGGLMTIGAFGDPNPEPYFAMLAKCRGEVAAALGVEPESLELSMGMSGDYDRAISAGSTNVRVGSTIFGERMKKA